MHMMWFSELETMAALLVFEDCRMQAVKNHFDSMHEASPR